jgi:short-subunit dehydrogenase
MGEMRNRVVVITGASSGFGRGAALKFAENGAKVVLAARRKRLLKQLAAECRGMGADSLVVETDVSSSSDVEELAERAIEKFGKIDVWVNNAGVGSVARFDETPLEEHEQVIQTNLMGTIYGSYAALQQFRKQDRGVLINVGSFAGKVAAPYLSSYFGIEVWHPGAGHGFAAGDGRKRRVQHSYLYGNAGFDGYTVFRSRGEPHRQAGAADSARVRPSESSRGYL